MSAPATGGDGAAESGVEIAARSPESRGPGFPVVGIGASAGGLTALEAFFSAMPQESEPGMAFVVVQHLAPDHSSILSELVRRYSRIPVDEVQDGIAVEPNRVYVIPPNRDMALENGTLRLFPPGKPRGQRLPIDFFFRSLANDQREHAICVVLSGTGSDGTLGGRAVKGEGGMVMAQEPSTTEYDGMPRSAIATGMVDYVLPPAEMPAQLIAYSRHAFEKPSTPARTPVTADDGVLKKLTTLLRAQTGHDFSHYKSTTLIRRMERRMALHQCEVYEDYFNFARENPAEVEALFRDLLIGVTNFFRDPEAFKVLEEVIAARMKAKSVRDQFRVWVCGCSTGEEAYSIAILLQEYVEASKRAMKIQVFATDLDHLAIEQARAGVFPASIAADVTTERLNRFFVYDQERDVYRVQKVIRDLLVFSEQDVIRDPTFSKLDLISCRNLLIYLNSEIQRKLIPLFHYSLGKGGVLFLGSSESVGEYGRLFSPVDRKWKIYNREAVDHEPTRLGFGEFGGTVRDGRDRQRPVHGSAMVEQATSWRTLTEQALLAHYAEAAVLINSRGDILYIRGKTGKYLEPAPGDAALNVLSMAREGLRRELTTGVHRVVAHKKPASFRGLRVNANGSRILADVWINPVEVPHGMSTDLYIVIIQERQADETTIVADTDLKDGINERIAELEHELKARDDYLQTTLEEMETTNEELKSTNEEMQSVNEELQSTNEELETSKEELQSVNEELSTVNAELQEKVLDLSRVNNDMNNLLAGTGVGTVFVDNSLRILRFTPSATQVINLIQSDLGRPVEHIVSNLVGYNTLVEDLRAVLETLLPKEEEVRTKSGVWYLLRIRPYRTMENAIEGAVLTFIDISERKRTEEKLRASEARYQSIFNQAFAGVTETDLKGRYTFVNNRFCEMLEYTREELLQYHMLDLTHAEDRARNRVLMDALVAGGPDFSVEKRYARRDGTIIWTADRVSGVRNGNKVTSCVVVSFDMSERRNIETDASISDRRLSDQLEALSSLDAMRSLTFSNTNEQAVFAEVLGAAIAINGADMGTLQMIDPQTNRLTIIAQRGFDRSYVEFWNNDGVDQGSSARGVQDHAPVIVEDVERSPIFANTPGLDVQLRAGVRAVHSIPLVSRSGRVVGVLSTHFRAPHQPDERKLHLFEMMAREVGELVERGTFESRLKSKVGSMG